MTAGVFLAPGKTGGHRPPLQLDSFRCLPRYNPLRVRYMVN